MGETNISYHPPAEKDSCNIVIDGRHVMDLNAPTVLEAMLYLLYVRFVDMCQTVKKQVSTYYRTQMRAALVAQFSFDCRKV